MKRYLPVLASLASQLVFGFAYFFVKMGMEAVGQDTVKFLAIRFVVAFVIMTVFMLIGVFRVDYKNKPLGLLLIAGVFNPIISQTLEFSSLKYAPTSQIAVFNGMLPLVIILVSILINKEYPTRRQVFFMGVCIAGVLIINLVGRQMDGGTATGIVLICCAILAVAVNRVFVRRASGRFSAVEIIYVTTGMGALGFSVFTLSQTVLREGTLLHFFDGLFTPRFLISLVYMSVGSCIFAFILMTYSSANLPIAVSSTLNTTSTVLTILVGVIFLKEPFRPIDVFGTIVIMIGLIGIAFSYNSLDTSGNRFHLPGEAQELEESPEPPTS